MFFPGETITHVFIIPFNRREIDHVVLSYKQNGAIMFEKTVTSGFEEDSPNTTKISYPLSQNESLLFEDDSPFTIQCNVHTVFGSRHTSHIMDSTNGIQYLRDVLVSTPIKILTQPMDCYVDNIGDTATFKVSVQGAMRYQWQYCVNDGEWKDSSNGTDSTYQIEATAERIATHKYRCAAYDYGGVPLYSDAVKIIYIDRSDE